MITKRQIRRDNYLRSLAAQPQAALRKWRRLRPGEDLVVVTYMAMFYGVEFARRFNEETKHRRLATGSVLITNHPEHTPQRLARQGYRHVPMDVRTAVDIWVHPAGNEVWLLPVRRGAHSQQPLAEDPGVAEALGYADDLTAVRDQLLAKLTMVRNMVGRPDYSRSLRQFSDDFNTWQEDLNIIREQALMSLREEVVEPRDQQQVDAYAERVNALDRWKRMEFPLLIQGLPSP